MQYTYQELKRIVESEGWSFRRQKGTHAVFTRKNFNHIVIPNKPGALSTGVVCKILKAVENAQNQQKKIDPDLSGRVRILEIQRDLEKDYRTLEEDYDQRVEQLKREHEFKMLARIQEVERRYQAEKEATEEEKAQLKDRLERTLQTTSSAEEYRKDVDEFLAQEIKMIDSKQAKITQDLLRIQRDTKELADRENTLVALSNRVRKDKAKNEEWVISRESFLAQKEDDLDALEKKLERGLASLKRQSDVQKYNLARDFLVNIEKIHDSLLPNLPSPPSINLSLQTEDFEELYLLQSQKEPIVPSIRKILVIIVCTAVFSAFVLVVQLQISTPWQMVALIPLMGFIVFTLKCFDALFRQAEYLEGQRQICESLQHKFFKSYEAFADDWRNFKKQENQYREKIETWLDECWSIGLNLVRKTTEQSQD